MILKELIIYSRYKEEVIKKYSFNDYGLNIILGNKSEEGNGSGKTSMVQSINYLLGSKIPKDFENRKKLNDLDILMILKIFNNEETIYLAREIKSKNEGFIKYSEDLDYNLENWEKFKDKQYKEKLEQIFMFDEEENSPSFASIREYLIRDEKEGFTNITLMRRNAMKSYEILNFLFGIDIHAEDKISKLKNEQDELEKSLKVIKAMSEDITEIKIKEKKLDDEVEELKNIANSVDVNKSLKLEKKDYIKLKSNLNEINEKIIKLENIKEQYELNIENLKSNVNKIKELDDVEEFYNQMLEYFPLKIKKNKEELKNYYEFMVNSRGRYFNKKIDELKELLKILEEKKIKLEKKIEKRTIALQSTSIVEDINVIIERINEKNQELSDLRYKIDQYSKGDILVNNINKIKKTIIEETNKSSEKFKKYTKIIEKCKIRFNEIVKATYKEDGILDFEFVSGTNKKDTTGRIKIQCSIIDENSHGRNYMKINMFDICWFAERIENEKNLTLLTHDGSYVKPDDKVAKYNLIRYIDEIMLNKKRGQYFITLNNDELLKEDICKLDNEKKIVASLGRDKDSDRFMGMKYV
ncbi:DUF2326 domain-containing protein [Clostridium perfringens]|uniref:DUF2326 domain-containing protein n=3 Tax=Clostridium perfringens TaxID=1502 RepID=UPI0013E40499|nr:DUF2326 domain-containing protein [Clostridium perfringens]EIF6152682.1 DUF2326 domain-containing protein [Clostridium perfringens]ELC8352442.1 DUF2326 domain-containing protein [Clostridium perfringens]MCX0365039.1 DUF2326 domain-containing protein [Clostridium perfringens]MDB2067885.1 DUF2326 domain-containing protein [Clostridium perfringens]MDK0676840.1 DUF2326 domain-containing protein [Clostridium perfringens]